MLTEKYNLQLFILRYQLRCACMGDYPRFRQWRNIVHIVIHIFNLWIVWKQLKINAFLACICGQKTFYKYRCVFIIGDSL